MLGSIDVTPLPNVTAGPGLLSKILSLVFAITGAISLLIITIAGFKFVISSGDSNRISQARGAILYALIGLIITISGMAIVTFVLNKT